VERTKIAFVSACSTREDVQSGFESPDRVFNMKVIGWWEDYTCGCTSETVRYKKDLVGYCPAHGANRRYVYPEIEGEWDE